MKIGYTTIMHEPRIQQGLDMNQYCILDLVYRLSTNPTAPVPGWCSMAKPTMAEFIGLGHRTVTRICTQLEADGYLIKSADGRLLKTTVKYIENVVNFKPDRWAEKQKSINGQHMANVANGDGQHMANVANDDGQSGQRNMANVANNNNNKIDKDLSGEPEIVQAVKKDHPILYESLLESHSFQERITRLIQSENLKADFHSDVIPIIHQWMKVNWVSGNIHCQPANKLVSQCTSFINSVLKNGGLKTGSGSKRDEIPDVIQGPKGMKIQ